TTQRLVLELNHALIRFVRPLRRNEGHHLGDHVHVAPLEVLASHGRVFSRSGLSRLSRGLEETVTQAVEGAGEGKLKERDPPHGLAIGPDDAVVGDRHLMAGDPNGPLFTEYPVA